MGSSATNDTSWTIIERAARGDAEARDRFARLYAPALVSYFTRRWKGTRHIAAVEDSVQEVFIDCFKDNGVLDRADQARSGGFRAFFYGVARTVALRCEQADLNNAKRNRTDDVDPDQVSATERGLSEVFDRAWAHSVVREAVVVHRTQARVFDGREKLRAEILRLRFEVGKPIREIATMLDLTPEFAHQEYAAARRGFRHVLEDVVAVHYADSELDITERCRDVLRLLS